MSVERSFDLAARLSTQTTEAGTFAWSCTPWNGLPAAITNLDSGLSVAYEYDVLDRITSIVWRKADGDILRSFGYSYDMAGCITNLLMEGEALPSRRTLYGYDMLDRLIAETTAGRTNAWSYDLADNRTNATHNGAATAYTLGIGDRLASTSAGATYLYNAAGCVTNISVPSVSSVVSLSWNSQYQLTAAYTNGVLAESYQYDALNRRISTTTGGTTTCHVYDGGWQVLADLDASGRPLRSYTWGPGIDNLQAVTVYGGSTTNTYYALTDHLGTVHALVAASGAIVESYEYDAWGNVFAIHDASGSPIGNRQSAIGNRYLFQGREYSYATGLCHFRMRWYDPATGRWLSNDPTGISGGLNQYVFCANNPVNFVDPLGLWGVQFGSVNLGVGDPWLAFDSDSWMDISQGAAATMDGLIPFADPFESAYADECGNVDSIYRTSRALGNIAQVSLTTAAGLGATRAINGALMPRTLYHFTSAEGAAGIQVVGGINASSGLYGYGTYLTGFRSATMAMLQGARATQVAIPVATEGLAVSPTYFPGTYIVRGAGVLLP